MLWAVTDVPVQIALLRIWYVVDGDSEALHDVEPLTTVVSVVHATLMLHSAVPDVSVTSYVAVPVVLAPTIAIPKYKSVSVLDRGDIVNSP
jgi:hypothetical protein